MGTLCILEMLIINKDFFFFFLTFIWSQSLLPNFRQLDSSKFFVPQVVFLGQIQLFLNLVCKGTNAVSSFLVAYFLQLGRGIQFLVRSHCNYSRAIFKVIVTSKKHFLYSSEMEHFSIISEVNVCFSVKLKSLFFLSFEIANLAVGVRGGMTNSSHLKCSNPKHFLLLL